MVPNIWHIEKCATFWLTFYKQNWLQFLIIKATTFKQQISKFHLQILNTEGSTTFIQVNSLCKYKSFYNKEKL